MVAPLQRRLLRVHQVQPLGAVRLTVADMAGAQQLAVQREVRLLVEIQAMAAQLAGQPVEQQEVQRAAQLVAPQVAADPLQYQKT